MTSVTHKKSDGTTVIDGETYVYDNAGNLTSKAVNGTSTSYTYDNADQILSESTTGYSTSYTYDANGNRATDSIDIGSGAGTRVVGSDTTAL